MNNEKMLLHHAELVAKIKDEVERIQRLRNAAPQMLNALKVISERIECMDPYEVVYWETYGKIIEAAIRAAEGNPN